MVLAQSSLFKFTEYNWVSVKAGLWTVDWTMDWTMDWVATHFIQSILFTLHHWLLVCDFTGKPAATRLALWHYVTRQFKLRAPDKTSATKSKQNYHDSNRLTKSKH